MFIKYVDLQRQYENLKDKILPKIIKVYESGNYILGDELKVFEQRIAEYCEVSHALGVANGTDALILALKALEVRSGDEVITPPNSFIATTGAIVAAGARPVFVDVGEDYNINSDLIENAITERTRAIMPVHLTGKPADMDRINKIAKKHDLYVIEDAAQAIGAIYKGYIVGSLGDIGCFSFHPLKTLHAFGDGGLITTKNRTLYEKLLKLRNHGLKNRNESDFFGFNSRLDEVHATSLNVCLDYLESWNDERRAIAYKYRTELSDIVETPQEKDYEEPVYHTFIIQTDRRDNLQSYLLSKGIETKIHYPIPIHLQNAAKFLGYREGDFPVTERQAKRILSLPMYPELRQEEIDKIIKGVKDFYGGS